MIRNGIFVLVMLSVALASCKDKNSEKRRALLDGKETELEAVNSPMEAINPTQPPKPPAKEKPEGPLAEMTFEKDSHDFGTIKEGEVVEHTYKFKNTGEVPLVIESAKGSCGCTASDWTKDPVPVGGEGFVKAQFNSSGKKGNQSKYVMVTANTWPQPVKLSFSAVVESKE